MIEGNLSINLSGFNLSTGDFKISDKKITIIYGDSGCGKSTFLNCLAGIENNYNGSISFKKPLVIGYVLQKNSLFPHLNVRENLFYAFKRCKNPRYTVDDISKSLSIVELLDKEIDSLSGGQTQRVSIARSILSSPDILLLDEPLSALHSQAKDEILNLIKSINKKYSIPILMVTHSVKEMISLCDNVIYMKKGSLLKQISRESALLEIDSNGPINCISGESLNKLGLKLHLKEYENFVIHSSNIILILKSEDFHFPANSILCTFENISRFNNEFSILKLRYLEDNFLYAKVPNEVVENLSCTLGQEVVALFGTDSHII